MDKIEKFILDHREEFDSEVPSLNVWAAIDKELGSQGGKQVTMWRALRVAAAVLVLLTVGGVGGYYTFQQQLSGQVASLAEVAPEYAPLEAYYHEQLDTRLQQLASYKEATSVRSDLEQLDAVFQELTKELAAAPKGSEEQIIQAMIRNYQTRLEILERVLQNIEPVAPQTEKGNTNEVSI
jgi:predicted PurR-regulated permease PerM